MMTGSTTIKAPTAYYAVHPLTLVVTGTAVLAGTTVGIVGYWRAANVQNTLCMERGAAKIARHSVLLTHGPMNLNHCLWNKETVMWPRRYFGRNL